MGGPGSQALRPLINYDIGKDFLKWVTSSRQREGHPDDLLKDLILTSLETGTRTNSGNLYRPPPGTKQYSLCQRLVAEGYLVRY